MTDTPLEIAAAVATAVQRRRDALGLSQAKLAAAAGLAKSTVYHVEQGDGARLTLATTVRLANALGLPLSALLGLDTGSPRVSDAEAELLIHLRRLFQERHHG